MADKKYDGIELNVPSRAQRDLEQRHATGYRQVEVDNTKDDVANPEVVNSQYAVEGNDTSGYLGVSEEYMTYANETDKPGTPEEGVEAEVLEHLQSGVPGVYKTEAPKDVLVAQVSGQRDQNLNTATSGESYSSTLVDRPEAAGPVRVVGASADESQTSAPVAPVAKPDSSVPAPKKATAR